ncbi:MAG: amidohydrolase family protein [Acidimicrobiia bacterium]
MGTSSAVAYPVIDVDTHLSEPHDLWTSRAPAAYAERVPRVVDIKGHPTWVADGKVRLGPATASAVVNRSGDKMLGAGSLFTTYYDGAHLGAYHVEPRLELMDSLGIWAQILYPNVVGFGAQGLGRIEDPKLRELTVSIWNDAMADIQNASGGRLMGMGILPWWDADIAVAELHRMAALGLHGVASTSDPQDYFGLPDLSDEMWAPVFEAIVEHDFPLNFHIGASASIASFIGQNPWPSSGPDVGLAIGSAMIYLNNARVLANFVYSGLLERYPTLKLVSVESGLGWVPFMLEALDHQLSETAPHLMGTKLSMLPSAYFRRQVYGCFWFENDGLVNAINKLGVDNCMFETDFPHPTCLYPDPLTRIHSVFDAAGCDETFRRKVMCDNAARVYNIDVSGV